jgi:hypothetical protein
MLSCQVAAALFEAEPRGLAAQFGPHKTLK